MHYTKMHGAGNSFVLVENLHGEVQSGDLSVLALRLCDPDIATGADGMIVLVPAGEEADFGMLFYNSDGSLGEMCGNGARCAARYGFEHGMAPDPDHIRIRATAGLVSGRKISTAQYEIRLNNPTVIDLCCHAQAGSEVVPCSYIELGSPGIPHAVVMTDTKMLDHPEMLRRLASDLRYSPSFPKGANVTFVSPVEKGIVRAVTYERGVEDFTLACGTGCAAAAVSLMLRGVVREDDLDVLMPGGMLHVRVHRDENSVQELLLTGPTAYMEEGDFLL